MQNALKYREDWAPMSPNVRVFPDLELLDVEDLHIQLLDGDTVHVCLEPGDATRYELLIVPIASNGQRGLFITRLVSYQPLGNAVGVLWDFETPGAFHIARMAQTLGLNNEWSRLLFGWWLCELLEVPQLWDDVRRTLTEGT